MIFASVFPGKRANNLNEIIIERIGIQAFRLGGERNLARHVRVKGKENGSGGVTTFIVPRVHSRGCSAPDSAASQIGLV